MISDKIIKLEEVFQRGAYCKKCGSILKLTLNKSLTEKDELITFCENCKHLTRTNLIYDKKE